MTKPIIISAYKKFSRTNPRTYTTPLDIVKINNNLYFVPEITGYDGEYEIREYSKQAFFNEYSLEIVK